MASLPDYVDPINVYVENCHTCAIIDTFASCMGQPWPAAREHVGNYFGKNGEQLDEYGHNLAAARLPGAGFRILHNDAVHLTRSIMREAGFISDSEAWNIRGVVISLVIGAR